MVAKRVERVYDIIHLQPTPTLLGRIKNNLSLGLYAGLGAVLALILDYIMLLFWEFLYPKETIEQALDFDYFKYSENREAFGDHTFKVSTYDKHKVPSTQGIRKSSLTPNDFSSKSPAMRVH